MTTQGDWTRIGMLAFVATLALGGTAGAQSWTSGPSLPEGRAYLAAGTIGPVVYATGGVGPTGVTSTVFALDTSAASPAWVAAPAMSTPRYTHGAAVASNLLYVMGGHDASGQNLASAEVFDPTANGGAGAWQPIADMPDWRIDFGAAAVGGIVYAVGGSTSAQFSSSTVLAFDPASGLWSPRRSMNQGRSNHAVVALGRFIYAIGGGTDSVERYDPVADAWTFVAPLPSGSNANGHLGAGVGGGKILAVGGYNGGYLTAVF